MNLKRFLSKNALVLVVAVLVGLYLFYKQKEGFVTNATVASGTTDRGKCENGFMGVLVGPSNVPTSKCYVCPNYQTKSQKRPVKNAQGVYVC